MRGEEYDIRVLFQSTCPARGTTAADVVGLWQALFQSTCPARGTTLSAMLILRR